MLAELMTSRAGARTRRRTGSVEDIMKYALGSLLFAGALAAHPIPVAGFSQVEQPVEMLLVMGVRG
jgi:hypothetical protein